MSNESASTETSESAAPPRRRGLPVFATLLVVLFVAGLVTGIIAK